MHEKKDALTPILGSQVLAAELVDQSVLELRCPKNEITGNYLQPYIRLLKENSPMSNVLSVRVTMLSATAAGLLRS